MVRNSTSLTTTRLWLPKTHSITIHTRIDFKGSHELLNSSDEHSRFHFNCYLVFHSSSYNRVFLKFSAQFTYVFKLAKIYNLDPQKIGRLELHRTL